MRHALSRTAPIGLSGNTSCRPESSAISEKCWQNGGRKNCIADDPVFRVMEADLFNLYPSVGEVNGDRINYQYGMVTGVAPQYGACTTRVDFEDVPLCRETRPRVSSPVPRFTCATATGCPCRFNSNSCLWHGPGSIRSPLGSRNGTAEPPRLWVTRTRSLLAIAPGVSGTSRYARVLSARFVSEHRSDIYCGLQRWSDHRKPEQQNLSLA